MRDRDVVFIGYSFVIVLLIDAQKENCCEGLKFHY